MEGLRIVGPEISFQDENGVIARLHDSIEVDEKKISPAHQEEQPGGSDNRGRNGL